jgi:hypothetical protein
MDEGFLTGRSSDHAGESQKTGWAWWMQCRRNMRSGMRPWPMIALLVALGACARSSGRTDPVRDRPIGSVDAAASDAGGEDAAGVTFRPGTCPRGATCPPTDSRPPPPPDAPEGCPDLSQVGSPWGPQDGGPPAPKPDEAVRAVDDFAAALAGTWRRCRVDGRFHSLGATIDIEFRSDHTYSELSPGGPASQGTWEVLANDWPGFQLNLQRADGRSGQITLGVFTVEPRALWLTLEGVVTLAYVRVE